MQNENYTACDAVARSLHKHMMSDLDLPLPLAKIPVSNCEQVVKQLILAWHGFARPMTFLKQEILSDHEERDATDEVHLLFSELDYFAQSVKKLEKMVNFSVEEQEQEQEQEQMLEQWTRVARSEMEMELGQCLLRKIAWEMDLNGKFKL